MTETPKNAAVVASVQTASTQVQQNFFGGQHQWNMATSKGQATPSKAAANRASSTTPVVPKPQYTLDQVNMFIQQWQQYASRLKKEKEELQGHYDTLYWMHEEVKKELKTAQDARDKAEELAKGIVGLRLDSRKV